MDDSNGNGIVPDAADEHSAVLSMLSSESWQKRLDEARKAREAVLAQRGVTQDLPARLKSAAPRHSAPSGLGQDKSVRGAFPPAPAEAGAETPEDEEEFPEFFPETDEDPPLVLRAMEPAATPFPSADGPAVGEAPVVEPAPPEKVKSTVADMSPLPHPVREAMPAQRGVTQDLPAHLKSAAPRHSAPSGVGQGKRLRGAFPPAPAEAGAETPEDEEEFPEFFPETDEDPPVVLRAREPAPAPSPSADGPAVGEAAIVEPAHPEQVKSAVAGVSPLRRPVRIAAGFALGLAAGVAATSLAWMMIGPTGGPAPRTEALAPSAPVVVPQTAALSPPDATPPMLTVSTASVPPDVTFVPAGAGSLPAVPPNGPEITKIELLARLSVPSDMPVNPAPQAADAQHRPDSAPAPRPVLQAGVPEVSFTPRADPLTLIPAAFALSAAQSGVQPAGPDGPDPAPRAIEPPPVAPQVSSPDPAEASVASAASLPQPETAPVQAPGALGPSRVNVMAPESVADVDLTATITGLQGAGFQLGDSVRVSFQVSKNHVRFYHASDRTAAEALAERIGGEARDFTDSDVNPPEGMIELWLQGSGQTVAAAKPAKAAARPQAAPAVTKEPEAPSEDSVMKSLRDKIVRQLQKGEHL